MRRIPVLALTLAVIPTALHAQEGIAPSFRDVISLERVGSPAIAPDGRRVAYTVRTTDWEENGYDTEIWLHRPGSDPVQVTRTADGSSTSPAWSPDGRWLAFLADRGDGRQVHALPVAGGEALPVTTVDGGVSGFAWSPDGTRLALLRTEAESDSAKATEAAYGRFTIEDEEYRNTHLWVVAFDPAVEPGEPRRLTGIDDPAAFTVGGFDWSPDGTEIAFDHRPDPLINSWTRTDLSVVDVTSAEIRPLVVAPSYQSGPIWSPDGEWILFGAGALDTTRVFFLNSELARVPAAGGEPQILTGSFDEDVSAVAWLPQGIVFTAWQRVRRRAFLLDPDRQQIRELGAEPASVFSLAFTPDGRHVAYTAEDPTALTEVFRAETRRWDRATKVTDMTSQIAGWELGSSEVITWTSEDGAEIEGVLRKPADYDPDRAYPLLVTIHGGPTGISRPSAVSGYVYPHAQWLAKGAVILEPNYRGSAGYGEAFRSLNVRNLGVGDAWDVMSGVRHLIDAGIAHPDSLGSMGWSQGGYISAFLTTTTDAFQAISVGAGISDWVTYYVNTDIHPFTRQYLRATPWEDPEIYATTSPMTYITDAGTPTLIQHGEFDQRVPIPNAYKLYQGLQDIGVPTELIVYEDFGHGITRPKEQLAATWHNWEWFGRWIWDETVEMPVEVDTDAGDAGG